MTDAPDESPTDFAGDHVQALQAFAAIRKQAPALMLMGNHAELRGFIEQFVTMAERTRDQAQQEGDAKYAQLFGDLALEGRKLSEQVAAQE